MKKKLLSLLAVAVMMVPLGASAAAKVKDSFTTKDCKAETKEGFTTYTCPLIVEKYENAEDNVVTIKFDTYGSAVTEVKCSENIKDGFLLNSTDTKINEKDASCVFVNANEVTKETLTVGNLVYTVEDAKVSEKHDNCGLSYYLGEAKGKINPETGISVPYIYIVGGIVLAAGVCAMTSKKTKLFKI